RRAAGETPGRCASLPLDHLAEDAGPGPGTPTTMTEALRLFLIEDDENVALLIRKTLERAGHHVTACRTAADALIVLGHSNFHLVLLDQVLPDMPGLDLLQAMNREGITTPVLMVTAFGTEQLATQV